MSKRVTGDLGYNLSSGQPNLILHIDDTSLKQWNRQIFSMIEIAGKGAEDLVNNMTNTVLEESKKYVPKDTFTLYNSAHKIIEKKYAIYLNPKLGSSKGYNFYEGTVEYGNNEQAGGPNPRSGLYPSTYAWKVHEDTSAAHPNGGQAKFLERAYREYIASELGPEMVQLERSIYVAKQYMPVFKNTQSSRTFTGKWTKRRKTERNTDTVTNLDRLSNIYANTKR